MTREESKDIQKYFDLWLFPFTTPDISISLYENNFDPVDICPIEDENTSEGENVPRKQ